MFHRFIPVLALAACAAAVPLSAENAPKLALPVSCTLGPLCQVQNYVDGLVGSGAQDFACGGLTYDSHKGTDFRVDPSAAVTVRAAAAGTVQAVRDGVQDVSIRNGSAASIAGRECGNGVLIGHGGGWVTQYCHLRKGSVRVNKGDSVGQGAVLGLVGLSGQTEFAHLHFEVRRDGAVVDPFNADGAPCGGKGKSLWAGALAYKPAALFASGFSDTPPELEVLEGGTPNRPGPHSTALVAWVRVLGVRTGDTETLTVTAPGGETFAERGPARIAASKVHWLGFVGRKLKSARWSAGEYAARYRLERGGVTLIDERFSLRLP